MPTPHYDGDYTVRTQVGDAVEETLLLERSKLFHVTYHQFRASFDLTRPSYNDKGERGTAWSGLPLVELSRTTDLGGGICAFTCTYAQVPLARPDFEQFAFEYQRISAGNIDSLSITVPSAITYRYYYTANPATIPCEHVFRAVKIGSNIIYVGTPPGIGATQFLGEDETKTRWKGNIWMKKTRLVPQLTYATLA